MHKGNILREFILILCRSPFDQTDNIAYHKNNRNKKKFIRMKRQKDASFSYDHPKRQWKTIIHIVCSSSMTAFAKIFAIITFFFFFLISLRYFAFNLVLSNALQLLVQLIKRVCIVKTKRFLPLRFNSIRKQARWDKRKWKRRRCAFITR